MASVVACIVVDAPLVSNSNRTGTYRSTLLVSPQSERRLMTMSTSRLPRNCPIPERFSCSDKELHRLSLARSRKRMGKVELHPPVVGSNHVPRLDVAWRAVDTEPPGV